MTQAARLRLVEPKPTDQPPPPPQDVDAERSVLSSVLVDVEALPKVFDFLRAEHFFSQANGRIFEACVALFHRKEPIDTQTVSSWLKARDRLKQVGGNEYVTNLISAAPTYSNVRAHAVAVHDMWRRRQVIKTCLEVSKQGYGSVSNVQGWCDEAVKSFGFIGAQNPVRPVESNDETFARLLAEIIDPPKLNGIHAPSIAGVPTEIYGLDRILGGLARGTKTTIAATTGAGKTAFASQLAISAAKRGLGVLFFSTEMKRDEVLMRALIHEAQVSGDRVKFNTLRPQDKIALSEAAKRLHGLPWRIDETPQITIEEIAASARAMAEQMLVAERVPLCMLIIDYIQRVEPSRQMINREPHEQVAHATKALKNLVREMRVIGVELAQAKETMPNRKPEKPKGGSGIADSSKIGKESEDIVYLWPEDDPKDDPRQSILAIVAKQRNGKKGEVSLMFRRDTYTFIDPNDPARRGNISRQYIDATPEPPESGNALTEGM